MEETLIYRLKCLMIYRQLLEDKGVKLFAKVLDRLTGKKSCSGKIINAYSKLAAYLLEKAELATASLVGDPWQNYLLEKILKEENTFTLKAEKVSPEEMGAALLAAVKQDLTTLRACLDLNLTQLQKLIATKIKAKAGEDYLLNLDWQGVKLLEKEAYPQFYYQETLKQKEHLYQEEDWATCLEDLAAYYGRVGTGLLGNSWAFHWEKGLRAVEKPDPIRLENLIGYTLQREKVVQNTEQFLAGKGANNLLLYGDRGTGKSSTIKALLHTYGQQGLRILEVHKHQMEEFSAIIRTLQARPQKFILFIDDLSFEEKETEYKYLKAILEGGLEAQPANVLVYATSNRRHLIKESFQDRPDGAQDLHIQDTVQEKLSLSDRFGLTVTFIAPDKENYLNIVDGLIGQKGLTLEQEKVHALALQWQLQHNGPSGRTAKQFVEDLTGKLTTKKEN